MLACLSVPTSGPLSHMCFDVPREVLALNLMSALAPRSQFKEHLIIKSRVNPSWGLSLAAVLYRRAVSLAPARKHVAVSSCLHEARRQMNPRTPPFLSLLLPLRLVSEPFNIHSAGIRGWQRGGSRDAQRAGHEASHRLLLCRSARLRKEGDSCRDREAARWRCQPVRGLSHSPQAHPASSASSDIITCSAHVSLLRPVSLV